MISDELYSRLMELTPQVLLNIMTGALSEMQGYNGQSETAAILSSMGVKEGAPRLPTVDELNTQFGRAPKEKAIVVVGNAFDGLRVYGPFDSAGEANNYADARDFNDAWYVVQLIPPRKAGR